MLMRCFSGVSHHDHGTDFGILAPQLGYALMLLVWSLAGAWHGTMRTVMGFMAARFALGLGEAGNFPAAIKTVAEWFPQ